MHMRHMQEAKKPPADMIPTMNSLVRKALLGTKRRRGPFFTMVYLQRYTGLSRSQARAKFVAVLRGREQCLALPFGTVLQICPHLKVAQETLHRWAQHQEGCTEQDAPQQRTAGPPSRRRPQTRARGRRSRACCS